MEKVVLTDKFWQSFIGQAYRENLITIGGQDPSIEDILKGYSKNRQKQEALILFLLYDRTVLSDDQLPLKLPFLEDAGHIHLCKSPNPLINIFKDSDWYKNRDPSAFAKALETVKDNEEFIIPKFANSRKPIRNALIKEISKETNTPAHIVLKNFIDFSYDYFIYGKSPNDHPFEKITGKQLASFFCELLSEGHSDGKSLHAVDTLLFGLMIEAERLSIAKKLSIEHKAPTAGQITQDNRYALNSLTNPKNPSTLYLDFCVVRQAFKDAELSIPIPASIKDAILMKNDVNFRPFREQLTLFQEKFSSGKIKDSEEILKEVKKARNHLKFSNKLTKGMRLVTYSSIPTAIVEGLFLGGVPAISMSTTIISTTAQAITDISVKNNSWVLFGK